MTKMTFSDWLVACRECATLSQKLDPSKAPILGAELRSAQRLLEDGDISMAAECLRSIDRKMNEATDTQALLTSLVETLRQYDGLEGDPLRASHRGARGPRAA